MIRGTCPQCGRTFTADDSHAGRTGRCRVCGAQVILPGRPDQEDHGPAGASPNTAKEEHSPPQSHSTGERRSASLQAYLDQAEESPPAAPAPEAAENPIAADVKPPPHPKDQPQAPAAEKTTAAPAGDPDHATEHFGRLSYEPDQGPTALAGPWLRDESGEQEQGEVPKAQDVLSGKLATPEPDQPGEITCPILVVLACIGLVVLSLSFLGIFALRGGVFGAGVGGLGLLLGLLATARLGSGHMDGLVPAVLHSVCIAGAVLWLVLAPSAAGGSLAIGVPAGGLLVGAALSLALTIAAAVTTDGYLYLHKHS